jgi:hypothetical protein
MRHPPHPYLPVPNPSGFEDSDEPRQPISHSHKHRWGWVLFLFAFCLSLAANLFALAFWLRCHKHGCSLYPKLTDSKNIRSLGELIPILYSPAPADSVLNYKPMVFTRDGVDNASIYEQDPSATVDTAWRELYQCKSGLGDLLVSDRFSVSGSTLPGQGKIPSFNETLEFVKKEGNQIRMLDVFHQLHCLVRIVVIELVFPNFRIIPGHHSTSILSQPLSPPNRPKSCHSLRQLCEAIHNVHV